jgi:hypothetical protein
MADEGVEQLSWKRSLRVFDSRIDDPLLREGASLRDYREIVAGMSADIDARLPGEYPPTLSVLLPFEDGREEGSKYPNFLSPVEVEKPQVRSMVFYI